MVYLYNCKYCKSLCDVIKPCTEASNPEICSSCGKEMSRVYTIPEVACVVSRPSEVFGIDMANKGAVQDMKKAYRDKTGSEMVEVGNERVDVKPKKQEYTLERGVFD